MKKRILSIMLTIAMAISFMSALTITASAASAKKLTHSNLYQGFSGEYYLASDLEADEELDYAVCKDTTIDLKGHTLTLYAYTSRIFDDDNEGYTLTIKDTSQEQNGKLVLVPSSYGEFSINGHLSLLSGTIDCGNTASLDIIGSFNMSGGKIKAFAVSQCRTASRTDATNVNISGGVIETSKGFATFSEDVVSVLTGGEIKCTSQGSSSFTTGGEDTTIGGTIKLPNGIALQNDKGSDTPVIIRDDLEYTVAFENAQVLDGARPNWGISNYPDMPESLRAKIIPRYTETKIIYEDGIIKLAKKAAGDYSIVNNTLDLNKDTNNGYITINKSTTVAKDTVNITVSPNTGYELDELKVYKIGDEATTVTVTDGKFEMPAYNVAAVATFKEISSATTPTFSNNTADSGYYAPNENSEDIAKEGIIAFTTFLSNFADFDGYTFDTTKDKFGMFIYKPSATASEQVDVPSINFTDLLGAGKGYFYAFVTGIGANDFDKTVIAKPYAIINGKTTWGSEMTTSVTTLLGTKYLGTIENKPESAKESE